jgi:hypothetical protein
VTWPVLFFKTLLLAFVSNLDSSHLSAHTHKNANPK